MGGVDDWVYAAELYYLVRRGGLVSPSQVRQVGVGLAADLLARDLFRAGALTRDGFIPWDCSIGGAIARIAKSWLEWGDEDPTPGAVVWLEVTDAGRVLGQAALDRDVDDSQPQGAGAEAVDDEEPLSELVPDSADEPTLSDRLLIRSVAAPIDARTVAEVARESGLVDEDALRYLGFGMLAELVVQGYLERSDQQSADEVPPSDRAADGIGAFVVAGVRSSVAEDTEDRSAVQFVATSTGRRAADAWRR